MSTEINVAKVEQEIQTLQDEITRLEHSGVKLENEITDKKRKYDREIADLKSKSDSELRKLQEELLETKQTIARKSLKLAEYKREIAKAHEADLHDALHGNKRH